MLLATNQTAVGASPFANDLMIGPNWAASAGQMLSSRKRVNGCRDTIAHIKRIPPARWLWVTDQDHGSRRFGCKPDDVACAAPTGAGADLDLFHCKMRGTEPLSETLA